MMRYSWTLCLLCLILPACLYKPQARIHSEKEFFSSKSEPSAAMHSDGLNDNKPQNQDYRLRALSCEARLPDVPIPVASDPIPDFFVERENTNDIVLGYITGNSCDRLSSFFRTEFVQLGWKIVAESSHVESLLIVEKPDRICTVSIRPLEDFNVFVLTICSKK
ncbi:MAG TPA: hypothetical protein PKD74_04495 [Candidatus Dependentiae bacterium]|nr:hypothetical protein [Candidatus Dependentiae bacterium]